MNWAFLQISSNGVCVNDVFIGYNKDTAAGVIYNVWESYKQENNHGIAFKEVGVLLMLGQNEISIIFNKDQTQPFRIRPKHRLRFAFYYRYSGPRGGTL